MSAEMPPDGGHEARPPRPGDARIARAIGALLCLAAGLKLFDLFDSYGEGIGWGLSLFGASVELLVGVALASGAWPTVVEPVAGLLFVLLTGVALVGTTRRAVLCGCLGPVPVPPWVPLIVDAPAAVFLLWGPRTTGRFRGHQFGALDAACVAAFLVGTFIGSTTYPDIGTVEVVTRNISVELIEESRVFTIDPKRFRGQPFFLGHFIRIDADLSRGRWKVILTRPGCRKCDRMLRSDACRPEGDERVAVVVARGKGARDRDWALPEGCQAILGELSPDKNWSFDPPMTFRLADGKVIGIP